MLRNIGVTRGLPSFSYPHFGLSQSAARDINISKLANALEIGGDGRTLLASAIHTYDMTVGSGVPDDLIVNDVHVGTRLHETVVLKKVSDIDEVPRDWESVVDNVYKNTRVESIWRDVIGNEYALVSEGLTYVPNADANTLAVLASLSSAEVLRHVTGRFFVVTKIGYNNGHMFIPGLVCTEDKPEELHPVTEIWGGDMANVPQTLNKNAMLYAPYIRKITHKRRFSGSALKFMSDASAPVIVAMPRLESIVGASRFIKSVIFSNTNMLTIYLPELTRIKNCVFGCNNKRLVKVSLPKLKEIDETVFLAMNALVTKLEFPELRYIKGCDFFLANDVTLHTLDMRFDLKLDAHDIVPVDASTTDVPDWYKAMLMATGINFYRSTFYRFNGTNSMSYFLNNCPALSNVTVGSTTSGGTTNPTYTTDHSKGIRFIYGEPCSFVADAYQNIDKYSFYEGMTAFLARREISASAGYSSNYITVNGATKQYYTETNSGVFSDGSGTGAGHMIPIDPRTLLLNRMPTDIATGATQVYSEAATMFFGLTYHPAAKIITDMASSFTGAWGLFAGNSPGSTQIVFPNYSS